MSNMQICKIPGSTDNDDRYTAGARMCKNDYRAQVRMELLSYGIFLYRCCPWRSSGHGSLYYVYIIKIDRQQRRARWVKAQQHRVRYCDQAERLKAGYFSPEDGGIFWRKCSPLSNVNSQSMHINFHNTSRTTIQYCANAAVIGGPRPKIGNGKTNKIFNNFLREN